MDDDEDLVQRLLTWAGSAMEIASVDAIVMASDKSLADRIELAEQAAADVLIIMRAAKAIRRRIVAP